jgi:triacylglycerol lipase
MPTIIKQRVERPLVLHSRVDRPLAQMSWLQRSLVFAELSMISYNDLAEATVAATTIGFPSVSFYDNDGSQAFRFRNHNDCVIACRGTEPNDWNDIHADVDAATVLADTVGRVHRGFKREVDDLWPMLEQVLAANRLPLWFCGHSLGGAMATICAGRCKISPIPSDPIELQTFGSPRVGDNCYVNQVELAHYRWVNNSDIVTKVPPVWLGYRHTGHEIYLDDGGRVRRLTAWQRLADQFQGFLRGLAKRRIDALFDHGIHRYVSAIKIELRHQHQELSDRIPVVTHPAVSTKKAAPQSDAA